MHFVPLREIFVKASIGVIQAGPWILFLIGCKLLAIITIIIPACLKNPVMFCICAVQWQINEIL